MEKIPCSVLILTRNSAATLEKCLKNLSAFGEILIHDANSEDDSVAIAKKFGAKVLKQYDTEEKSVRVTNFTDMRLKQRADAAFDWVLYIDSDEYLSDALVSEVGEILKNADPKTILKFPRVSVIDGTPRTRGVAFPEIMPRVHHRKSGATLRAGKTVHEKYQYDSSFREIITKAPLYVPLDPVSVLQPKDDRYIELEVERMRVNGCSLQRYVRWFLLREPALTAWYFLKVLSVAPFCFFPDSLPFSQNFRFVRYHWKLFFAVTNLMFKKCFHF